MTLFQKGISNFRTFVLGHLSPGEAQAVRAALHTLRGGWPGHDADVSGNPRLHVLVKRANAFIAELESSDPKRNRAVLGSAEFQTWLATEELRNKRINSVHYFKHMQNINLREALLVCGSDYKLYCEAEKDASLREANFTDVDDDAIRLEIVSFCRMCVTCLLLMLNSYDPLRFSEERLKEDIVSWYKKLFSKLSDEQLQQRLDNIDHATRYSEPDRILYYLSMFREIGWREQFIEAQRAIQAQELSTKLLWITRIEEKIRISPSGN